MPDPVLVRLEQWVHKDLLGPSELPDPKALQALSALLALSEPQARMARQARTVRMELPEPRARKAYPVLQAQLD